MGKDAQVLRVAAVHRLIARQGTQLTKTRKHKQSLAEKLPLERGAKRKKNDIKLKNQMRVVYSKTVTVVQLSIAVFNNRTFRDFDTRFAISLVRVVPGMSTSTCLLLLTFKYLCQDHTPRLTSLSERLPHFLFPFFQYYISFEGVSAYESASAQGPPLSPSP